MISLKASNSVRVIATALRWFVRFESYNIDDEDATRSDRLNDGVIYKNLHIWMLLEYNLKKVRNLWL